MAKEKPQYEIVEGFTDLLDRAINNNEDRFGHIDPKMIRMAQITNKEPPECGPQFKIIRINNPVALVCPYRYMVVTWQQVWDEFSEDRKALMVFDILLSLEPDEEEPKLIAPDIKAHGTMLRTFGVDYMDNPSLKNLLSKPIDWKDASDFDASSFEDDKPAKPETGPFDDLDKFNDDDFGD